MCLTASASIASSAVGDRSPENGGGCRTGESWRPNCMRAPVLMPYYNVSLHPDFTTSPGAAARQNHERQPRSRLGGADHGLKAYDFAESTKLPTATGDVAF